ncbi:MAG: xylulokinase [Armatimonadota bacterium]
MPYLLGIDIGTSGTKTLLIDVSGRIIASATYEYPLSTPHPLWAEQHPDDWWKATVLGIKEVLRESGIDAGEIAGVGLSGQMHGSVFLDSNNLIIRPAILWCDQRTAEQCAWITERAGRETVVAETLNPVLTGFTAPKIVWLQQKEPQAWAQVEKILLPKDYIRFRLTEEYATEVSDASGTSLLNVTKRAWSEPMMAACNVTESMLPKVFESPEVSGKICAHAASLTGLKEGTPVVGGGGDQAAGAVGNGIVEEGIASCSVGTSGVLFAHMRQPHTDKYLRTHTFCAAVPGEWHVMGVQLSSGGSLRWYRDAIADCEVGVARAVGIDPYEILMQEAATAPAGCEGLIFLPYLTGERTPYPDPYARGVFFGLTLRHTKADMVRSVLEGVSYGLRDSLEIFHEMGVNPSQIRLSGGGARSKLWRQIQADIYGRECVTINVEEGPAFGVALLAGVGTGLYPSVQDACSQTIQVADRTVPIAEHSAAYARYYPIYRSLYASLKDEFLAVAKAHEALAGAVK